MGTLLRAGLPLNECLSSVHMQITDPIFKGVTENIITSIRSGTSLASSLEKHPQYFDEFYSSVIAAGEKNGGLDTTFDTVYNYLLNKNKLKKKITSALVYPVFLLVFSIIAVMFLSMAVLPTFSNIYDSFESELPKVTQLVLWSSDIVRNYWYLMGSLAVFIVYILKRYLKTFEGKLKVDSFFIKLPFIGEFIYKKETTSFFPLLSLSLKSGMDIVGALRVAEKTIRNSKIKKDVEQLILEVMKGRRLNQVFNQIGFPSLVIQFISAGETSNNLEEMLDSISNYYLDELEESIDIMISLIEPIMIIVVGSLVGVIVMAIMLPILSLSTAVI